MTWAQSCTIHGALFPPLLRIVIHIYHALIHYYDSKLVYWDVVTRDFSIELYAHASVYKKRLETFTYFLIFPPDNSILQVDVEDFHSTYKLFFCAAADGTYAKNIDAADYLQFTAACHSLMAHDSKADYTSVLELQHILSAIMTHEINPISEDTNYWPYIARAEGAYYFFIKKTSCISPHEDTLLATYARWFTRIRMRARLHTTRRR